MPGRRCSWIGRAEPAYSAAWQTASMLWPSGPSTKAPYQAIAERRQRPGIKGLGPCISGNWKADVVDHPNLPRCRVALWYCQQRIAAGPGGLGVAAGAHAGDAVVEPFVA